MDSKVLSEIRRLEKDLTHLIHERESFMLSRHEFIHNVEIAVNQFVERLGDKL